MPNNIVIIGYSGHAYSVIDAVYSNNKSIEGYFEKQRHQNNPYDLQYLGDENKIDLGRWKSKMAFFACIGNNHIREKIIQFIDSNDLSQTSIIHKNASISKNTTIELSCFIGNGAIINPQSIIKKGAIINTGAIIEHECEIGEYAHIGPGAVLAGNVRVGKNSLVGAGSVVKPGVSIGNNSIVGAGSVVVKDIPDHVVYAGNPCKWLKDNE